MQQLSIVIITHNEEENILRCLDSVKNLSDEIIVIDSMSTDHTPDICREYGCRVISHEFLGYGQQKQYGTEQASNNWILSIDADEVVSETLRSEIRSLLNQEAIIQAGFRIPFSLFYMGRILRFSGTGNEYHMRLFDRTRGKFTEVAVHEGIEVQGPSGTLKGKIIHYSYKDIYHHLQKINTYTTQAAEGNIRNGKTFTKTWVILKFSISFFTFYFIKLGILDGYPGFLWSFFAALYGSMKVAKTIEMRKKT